MHTYTITLVLLTFMQVKHGELVPYYFNYSDEDCLSSHKIAVFENQKVPSVCCEVIPATSQTEVHSVN